ncbi:MAG: hypothetical protein ACPHRO_07375, partial [Nannocystaceae bacterium]
CSHVVVVAAGLRSGSVQTGRMALRQGRQVAVVTGTLGAGQLAGAGALTLGPPDCEVLASRTTQWLRGAEVTHAADPWPEHLRFLRNRVKAHVRRQISANDFEDPNEAMEALFEAELAGYLVEVAPGVYAEARGPRDAS